MTFSLFISLCLEKSLSFFRRQTRNPMILQLQTSYTLVCIYICVFIHINLCIYTFIYICMYLVFYFKYDNYLLLFAIIFWKIVLESIYLLKRKTRTHGIANWDFQKYQFKLAYVYSWFQLWQKLKTWCICNYWTTFSEGCTSFLPWFMRNIFFIYCMIRVHICVNISFDPYLLYFIFK